MITADTNAAALDVEQSVFQIVLTPFTRDPLTMVFGPHVDRDGKGWLDA